MTIAVSDESDNYDDYLDQLCDEEEEEPAATKSFDLGTFFIDTKPSNNDGETGLSGLLASDPFEDDFPEVSRKKKKGGSKSENSLSALVSQESIDDAIAKEEGKVGPPLQCTDTYNGALCPLKLLGIHHMHILAQSLAQSVAFQLHFGLSLGPRLVAF